MLHESLILLEWKFRECPPPPHDCVLLLKLSIANCKLSNGKVFTKAIKNAIFIEFEANLSKVIGILAHFTSSMIIFIDCCTVSDKSKFKRCKNPLKTAKRVTQHVPSSERISYLQCCVTAVSQLVF